MKQLFIIDVVRPAFAKVAVSADTIDEARELAYDRAHETVGLEDYVYGDFELA